MAEEKNNVPNQDDIPESNAARRLKGLGIDPNSSPADDIEIAPVSSLENFWYHHKWKTIISVFAAILLVICTMQMCRQNSYDIYVMYAGPGYMTANEVRSAQSAMGQLIPDHNGNGKRDVMLSFINYLSPQQIAEKEALAKEQDVDLFIDRAGNASALERFQMEVAAGESVIYLLDPKLYESIKEAGGLLRLDEVLDEIPDEALDEYGILLSETDFYQSVTALQYMPEDTVLCIRKISTMSVFKGQRRTEELHTRHVELFRQIIAFDAE